MIDPPKVGIIYGELPPRLSIGDRPPEFSCTVVTFQEAAILSGPVDPSKDFLAVFVPVDRETPESQRHLSALFPGAEIIAYRNPAGPEEALVRRDDGRRVVTLPMPSYLITYLLQDLSSARGRQAELSSVRRRMEEVRDLLQTFANTVEYSTDAADRKFGMSLLIGKIQSHVQAEECILYLLDQQNAILQRSSSIGNLKELDLFEQQANSSLIDRVLNSGKPYIDNNYDFEVKVPFSESVFIKSIMCYPIIRRGERIGVIQFLNKEAGDFSADDRAIAEMLLDPLAIAIRTVNMFESSERLTITDDLTKLYNYRYLMKYLESDVKRCLRYKKKVSLLFIDVDGFKRINDTFGHLVGSQALAEIAQVFKRIVRETDVVGRYGGDEFVIVLPETPLNGAMIIAERIRKKVEECEFVTQDLSIRLTVSLGVANCPKHTLTAEGLIKKADAAMYRAKELSKNSIKVAV